MLTQDVLFSHAKSTFNLGEQDRATRDLHKGAASLNELFEWIEH